jgi:Na+-transporting methylmalonyl-CoA/oxaloacetate decarboxylase gamma subunit
MSVLSQALWITVLSMGLVFAALILLAGLMSAMTRIFRDRISASVSSAVAPAIESDDRARAAALAVAVALAEQSRSTARPLTPPQPTIIGAWQLGMRTRQMTQKGEMRRRGKE